MKTVQIPEELAQALIAYFCDGDQRRFEECRAGMEKKRQAIYRRRLYALGNTARARDPEVRREAFEQYGRERGFLPPEE